MSHVLLVYFFLVRVLSFLTPRSSHPARRSSHLVQPSVQFVFLSCLSSSPTPRFVLVALLISPLPTVPAPLKSCVLLLMSSFFLPTFDIYYRIDFLSFSSSPFRRVLSPHTAVSPVVGAMRLSSQVFSRSYDANLEEDRTHYVTRRKNSDFTRHASIEIFVLSVLFLSFAYSTGK